MPGWPSYQQSGVRHELRLAGKRRVSFSGTVSYGFLDAAAPGWTDCVRLSLARQTKDGADVSPAFIAPAGALYVESATSPADATAVVVGRRVRVVSCWALATPLRLASPNATTARCRADRIMKRPVERIVERCMGT